MVEHSKGEKVLCLFGRAGMLVSKHPEATHWIILTKYRYTYTDTGEQDLFGYRIFTACQQWPIIAIQLDSKIDVLLQGAVAEAAFMTGLERNSDIVALAAYAPLFTRHEARSWSPDAIVFDNHRYRLEDLIDFQTWIIQKIPSLLLLAMSTIILMMARVRYCPTLLMMKVLFCLQEVLDTIFPGATIVCKVPRRFIRR